MTTVKWEEEEVPSSHTERKRYNREETEIKTKMI